MSREVFSLAESKTEVERPHVMTDEDVKAHIKAIGEAIVADAERMDFRAGKKESTLTRLSPRIEPLQR